MKILILGHGRHGKDTVAELLAQKYDLKFTSSSMAACKAFIFQALSFMNYATFQECFDDRHNHRGLWYELIRAVNCKDRAKLCKHILAKSNMYVGMRCEEEYKSSKHLFDHIIYVSAFERIKDKDETMKIKHAKEMICIFNNGTEEELAKQIQELEL
jgi:cytidylate kinase